MNWTAKGYVHAERERKRDMHAYVQEVTVLGLVLFALFCLFVIHGSWALFSLFCLSYLLLFWLRIHRPWLFSPLFSCLPFRWNVICYSSPYLGRLFVASKDPRWSCLMIHTWFANCRSISHVMMDAGVASLLSWFCFFRLLVATNSCLYPDYSNYIQYCSVPRQDLCCETSSWLDAECWASAGSVLLYSTYILVSPSIR